MKPEHSPTRKISPAFIVILVFCFFFTFRLAINIGTMGVDDTTDIFRVGVIPWSDARGWLNGSIQIMDGEQMSGVAARRPLYPLFLSTIFTIFGTSYRIGIFIQMFLLVLVLTGAYQLLKTNKDRFSTAAFLSLLAVWRPTITTTFLTENLGISTIALAFAFLWRGFNTGSSTSRYTGIFLIGLSQAVRPWCFVSLATVPLMSFFQNTTIRVKFRSLVASVLFILLGYSFHPLVTTIFNSPGEASSFSKTLYGQVKGEMAGWTSIYQDPIIVDSLKKDISPKEINKVINKRAYELFMENPRNFFISSILAYKHHFKDIPSAFIQDTTGKSLYFTGFLIILLLMGKNWRLCLSSNRNHLGLITIPAVLLMLNWQYSYSLTFLSALGAICVLHRRQEEISVFILLFFCGIIFSIPFVGIDGDSRVKLGSDILLYLLSSIGLSELLRYFCKPDAASVLEESTRRTELFTLYGIISLALVVFIAIPWMKNISNRAGENLSRIAKIGAEEIADDLGLDNLPIGPKELNVIWHQWPRPSFDKVNGKTVYYPIRYTSLDALYFNAGEGVDSTEGFYLATKRWHWPLSPLGFRRTIMVLEERYTLFPNIEPKNLIQYEDTKIIVIGTLHSRHRVYLSSTGFVLIVSHIGYVNKSGKLEWMSL